MAMGAEEEGTVEVRKKDKKSKKGKKNEVSGNGICEAESEGKNRISAGCMNAEKEDCGRGDIENEKKKKKKARNEVREDGGDGYGEREKGNDNRIEFENNDGNAMEKIEKKKRKRDKNNSIGSDERLKEQDFEDPKCGSQSNVNETCRNKMQNGKEVEVIGGTTDGDVVKEVEKKRKKKKKKMVVDSGALQQDTENEKLGNKDQGGKGVKLEAFGEDCELNGIEKQEKKKRKREK